MTIDLMGAKITGIYKETPVGDSELIVSYLEIQTNSGDFFQIRAINSSDQLKVFKSSTYVDTVF